MKASQFIFALSLAGFCNQSSLAQDIPLPDLKKAIMSQFTNLPMKLDEETRVDKVEVGYNEILYYNTLVNYDYSQIGFPALREAIKPNLIQSYCKDPTVESLRTAKVSWIHLYYGKNGELIGTIKTNLSTCS